LETRGSGEAAGSSCRFVIGYSVSATKTAVVSADTVAVPALGSNVDCLKANLEVQRMPWHTFH